MKINKTILFFLLIIMLFSLSALGLTIKLGSIAPDRSPWDKAMEELGREWARITNGTVKIKIYPGGIAGNEEDTIRKMRMGILGGAALTNWGLIKLYQEMYVLNIPLLFNSEAELDYVLERLIPQFEKEIEGKGFKLIIWTKSGWINFFTEKPVLYPKDMRKYKISFTTGEPRMEQAWKKSGYQVVPQNLKDLMMALQSGMVNAFYLPPLIAASGQYFSLAPHMSSLKIAPLVGGIVLSQRVWQRIPEKYREEMLAVTRRLQKKLSGEIGQLEKEAIDTMIENGLKIHEVTEDAVSAWRSESFKGMDVLVGKAFSKEIYEKVNGYLEEYRKLHENKN
jgi:TRAP-type C4-dicarboxylate transport system substrate-binding protein